MLKKAVVLLFSVILVAFSVSVVLRCAIGVGAWDAFSQTASGLLNIKVGTFSMAMNFFCVAMQMLILKEIKIALVLQVLLAIVLGVLVNFFYYELLGNWHINSYVITLMLFLLGNISCAFAVGTVTAQNVISFPLEGLCMAISKKTSKSFGLIRQMADIVTMALVIVLVLAFDGLMSIREGTVIGMIIFGPLLELYMKRVVPIMYKFKIFD
ncbi:MAG: hypothetical protein EOM50_24625 [Erysipelotrichia bacterium]|nr:hypothetical protein [Erysipelotrichaceae bacterium]NBL01122.1 hypothetical protein [Erysipelotrichia bacterium]